MNGLTVNLHLMLATFYRPTPDRFRILIDEPTFPSDRFAVTSHLVQRGLDPGSAILPVARGPGSTWCVPTSSSRPWPAGAWQWCSSRRSTSDRQWLDVPLLTDLAHRHGALLGLDLAHAAGNVPLRLHDWASILPSGALTSTSTPAPAPWLGASSTPSTATISACHAWPAGGGTTRPRGSECSWSRTSSLARWQTAGNCPTRPSCPWPAAVVACAVRRGNHAVPASEVGTAHRLPARPAGDAAVGPLRADHPPRPACARLPGVAARPGPSARGAAGAASAGVLFDFREPDIVRVAPVPLYNTFREVWSFDPDSGRGVDGHR